MIKDIFPKYSLWRWRYPASIPLPYYAPALPSELPSVAVIESSRDLLNDRLSVKVARVGYYIVKYGTGVDLEEGQIMVFIKEHTKVPLPQVYALYQDDKSKQKFIIMEYIDGQNLQELWLSLDPSKKIEIAIQLKQHFRNLRAVPSPNAYCNLDCRNLRHLLVWRGKENGGGPFHTESEFNRAIIAKCRESETFKGKADFYEKSLASIFRKHPPVLTHGDLSRKNIVIRYSSLGRLEVVLLDWETAGWYPSYWEWCTAMIRCGWFKDDWHSYVTRCLKPFWNEYACLYVMEKEFGW